MKAILAKEGVSQLIQMQKACMQEVEKRIGYGGGGQKHCLGTEGQKSVKASQSPAGAKTCMG